MIRVTVEPAAILHRRADEVTNLTRALGHASRLETLLRLIPTAAGVAAPQLDMPLRLIAFRLGDRRIAVLANPVLTAVGDATDVAIEGCLSLPGVWVLVRRHLEVEVTGLLRDGKTWTEFEGAAYGAEARVLQHEVDHLDGVLITDRAESEDEVS